MKRMSLLVALLAAAPAAMAQGSKPLHIVVPYAAGGAVDVVSRAVGQRMSELTGSPVIVDNRPGGNANIGADAVAKSAPDGTTLLMGANGLATNVSLFKSLPYDARTDFAPVARVGYAPLVLVVAPESPAKSVKDLIALAKSHPGRLNYGSAGNGSSQHLATELLRLQTGINVVHVPYKGGAPAITDLMGGRLAFFITNPVEVAANIKAGRLRALAVASPKRLPMLPEVPTFAEGGVAGYEAFVWWGLFAPAKTPKDTVAKLGAEALKALEDPGIREKLSALGAVVDPLGPEAFDAFYRNEIDKWGKVVRTSGIQPD
ncbi:MAG TPA: tripartite tricarboxylate transporter substrate binding protein [Burkholderiales bacterium]|nr:tripartite tricarboxylate transporter substrate binding protein [Burkholderiales bacterium]